MVCTGGESGLPVQVLAISGSLRQSSSNSALVESQCAASVRHHRSARRLAERRPFNTPPASVQTAPVPTHAMHLRKFRRSSSFPSAIPATFASIKDAEFRARVTLAYVRQQPPGPPNDPNPGRPSVKRDRRPAPSIPGMRDPSLMSSGRRVVVQRGRRVPKSPGDRKVAEVGGMLGQVGDVGAGNTAASSGDSSHLMQSGKDAGSSNGVERK